MEEEKITTPLISAKERGLIISSDLPRRFLIESKALWRIAGAAIFARFATFGLNVITQAFVGHLGNLELAAFSMVTGVILGFTSGLIKGMATALGTLCGQAYGAQKEEMLGVYMQRSWIVISGFAVAILPIYIFTTPLLKLLGQPDDIAELSGRVSLWCIPIQFAFVFYYTLSRYLQAQSKNFITAWSAALGAVFNVLLCWLFVTKWKMGLDGALLSLNVAWWTPVIIQYVYVTCGWCPNAWTGYSLVAFEDMWHFFKLSLASGIMLCLEIWYYRVLVLLTGNMKDTEVAVDSLSICVRVANELGAGRPKGAKFSVIVAVITSVVIGLAVLILILALRNDFSYAFTDSLIVQKAVYKLAILLGFTVLLNSIQPVLMGVAVGLGWQVCVTYINIGCYYIIGLPLGILLGYLFHLEVMGIWLGMICGTAAQTLALVFITWRTNWHLE
ncbi:hypothetical protein KI387_027427, partial [Taxus chinensis]